VADAAPPLVAELGLASVDDVPLGFPEMFSWVTLMPVWFLQSSLKLIWALLTKVTSAHYGH
jgi:hypothetical protein